MPTLSALQIEKINTHALACYPQEMCGLLTADDFIPLENQATDSLRSFSIAPVDYARYAAPNGPCTAIVHSHCKPVERVDRIDLRTPSRADIAGQRRTSKPWLIVGCEGMTVSAPLWLPRTPSNQYTGRPFIWYVNDCYTLAQDYYRFELGIELPGHATDFDWADESRLAHAFDPYVADYGFVDLDSIDDMRNGDLLLLNSCGLQHNHLGVYHDGQIIHQDGISRSVPFSTYIGRINRVLRYAD
jgi:proteasome lid subunit RPN8/RPN11